MHKLFPFCTYNATCTNTCHTPNIAWPMPALFAWWMKSQVVQWMMPIKSLWMKYVTEWLHYRPILSEVGNTLSKFIGSNECFAFSPGTPNTLTTRKY